MLRQSCETRNRRLPRKRRPPRQSMQIAPIFLTLNPHSHPSVRYHKIRSISGGRGGAASYSRGRSLSAMKCASIRHAAVLGRFAPPREWAALAWLPPKSSSLYVQQQDGLELENSQSSWNMCSLGFIFQHFSSSFVSWRLLYRIQNRRQ